MLQGLCNKRHRNQILVNPIKSGSYVVWFRRNALGPPDALVPPERSLAITLTQRWLTVRASDGDSHKYKQLLMTADTLAPGDDKSALMQRLQVRVSVLKRSPLANKNGAITPSLSPRCE